MTVRIVRPTGGNRTVTGPADLAAYGEGDTLYVMNISDIGQARWAQAIGLFVIRGGRVGS